MHLVFWLCSNGWQRLANGMAKYHTCILFAPAEMYLISPINLKWPSHIHTYVLILKLLLHNTWPSQTHAQWLSNFWARTIQKCSMFCVECQSSPRKGSIFIHDVFPHFFLAEFLYEMLVYRFLWICLECLLNVDIHLNHSWLHHASLSITRHRKVICMEETCWGFFGYWNAKECVGGGPLMQFHHKQYLYYHKWMEYECILFY